MKYLRSSILNATLAKLASTVKISKHYQNHQNFHLPIIVIAMLKFIHTYMYSGHILLYNDKITKVEHAKCLKLKIAKLPNAKITQPK